MGKNDPLKPNDFPVHANKKKIIKNDGKELAEAESTDIADDVAGRLNSEEAQREEDCWA